MAENGGMSAGWVAALTAGAALLGALAGFGGAVATGWFAYASKNEELQVHLVEIAMGILHADPSKEDVAPAREWALDVIDQKSGVKFSPEDLSLIHISFILSGLDRLSARSARGRQNGRTRSVALDPPGLLAAEAVGIGHLSRPAPASTSIHISTNSFFATIAAFTVSGAATPPRNFSACLRHSLHDRTKRKGRTNGLRLDLAFKFSLSRLKFSQFVSEIRDLLGDNSQFSLGLFARQVF